MESWLAVATLQQRQHFGDFQDTSRPAVDEEERNGSFYVALLVYEMHVDRSMLVNIDLNFVVRQRVELGFVCSPVELGAPMVNDSLDFLANSLVSSVPNSRRITSGLHRSAVVPTWPIFELVWKFCIVQPPLQSVQLLLRNVDLVLFDSRHLGVFVWEGLVESTAHLEAISMWMWRSACSSPAETLFDLLLSG